MHMGGMMPLDLRSTIFSNAELVAALLDYAQGRDVTLPLMHPHTATLTWDPELEVKVLFLPDAVGREEILSFERNEVAAALILYCHRFNEPVPHHAEKSLAPYKDGLQFLIRFPWGPFWNADHPARKATFPALCEED